MNLYDTMKRLSMDSYWDERMDSVHIVAYVKQENSEDWHWLAYAEEDWPEEVVEKYRPNGFDATDGNVTSSGMATEAAG